MGRSEVDAVLARLVAQFASPYDFVRELVQNAMDAGSDRVDVSLECHEDPGGAAVFELTVMDTGSGMDEAIIDGALTRLFSSSKADDRTMAGGFGVGFVSIFAWEPQLVLLQTGRAGEAWELVFHADRRFEKQRLDLPVEGTTITMFRRGDAGLYPAVAEALRDALWRWCRYCPLEITFEDLSGDLGPELIMDAPVRDEQVLARTEPVGDGEIRVAFGVPSHAVLLRRGLILAEGSPEAHLEGLRGAGETVDHLQLWIDSPDLETTLARDQVVASEGRAKLEARVLASVSALRTELLDELLALVADPGRWTAERAARYGTLHAHLQLEWEALGERAIDAPILRLHGEGGALAITPRALRRSWRGGPMCWVEPELELALPREPPLLVARDADDRPWLERLAERLRLPACPWAELHGEVEAAAEGDPLHALAAEAEAALRGMPVERGFRGELQVRAASRTDGRDADPPLCAWGLGGSGAVAVTGRHGLPSAALASLWLDGRHLLIKGALRARRSAPRAALISLLSALLNVVDQRIEPAQLAEWMEEGAPGG